MALAGSLVVTLVAVEWARPRFRWRQPRGAGLGPAALPRPWEGAVEQCRGPRSARLNSRFA
eukprot:9106650-Pyramimonas_sp.AAC.1